MSSRHLHIRLLSKAPIRKSKPIRFILIKDTSSDLLHLIRLKLSKATIFTVTRLFVEGNSGYGVIHLKEPPNILLQISAGKTNMQQCWEPMAVETTGSISSTDQMDRGEIHISRERQLGIEAQNTSGPWWWVWTSLYLNCSSVLTVARPFKKSTIATARAYCLYSSRTQ